MNILGVIYKENLIMIEIIYKIIALITMIKNDTADNKIHLPVY